MKMIKNFSEALILLHSFAEVQKWEVMNIHLMRSASGRQLYYGLIRNLVNQDGEQHVGSMKEMYCDDGILLTERGVRLAMRALEAEGEVFIERTDADRRSRKILLSKKLQEKMISHAEVVRKELINKDLLF
jgi:hypothetical protein